MMFRRRTLNVRTYSGFEVVQDAVHLTFLAKHQVVETNITEPN